MEPVNRYLMVEPVETGVIATDDSNVYRVVMNDLGSIYMKNDKIIVEKMFVIQVLVGDKPTYFVKEDNVLAREGVDETNRPCATSI